MMNQGGATDTITAVDTNSLEGQKNQAADSIQAHLASSYAASTDSATGSCTVHRTDSFPVGNGYLSNPSYHHDQHAEPPSSVASGSSSVSSNAPQDYRSYSTYPSTDPYGYNTTAYTGYYNGYQQPNTSYPHSVGAYQSSGAPYQPFSSFQNTGSYAGPPNYSSTYYNPGDYQTSGSYLSGSYNNQANYLHQGNYATYTSQYPNYPSDSNSTYSYSNASSTSQQLQQQYKQWADYYSQTDVTCAPGTENVSVPGTSNLVCPVPGVAGGYSASNSQPPASFTSSWRPNSNPPAVPSVQSGHAVSNAFDGYWKHGASEFQNHHVNSVQSTFQKPSDGNLAYVSLQGQQKPVGPQRPNTLYPATHQIPTNPRIAPNFALGIPKTDKDSSMTTPAAKPAYISTSLPKSNDKVPSHDTADSILKPGMFPKSLHGYVERALARCKDDAQRIACQAVMKEVITKANADGTLYTRDWDTEPLFPLPNQDAVTKESLASPVPLLPKNKRSPSRRSKSRWEPVPEYKLNDKSSSLTHNTVKYFGWGHPNGKDKQFSGGKTDKNDDILKNVKFSVLDQKIANMNAPRPAKRQRICDGPVAADNDDVSSDSDKEQNLTAYYSGAIALADSTEEKKRRENRSKRFDKGRGNRSENNHFRPKSFQTGNLYTSRASTLVLSKIFEEGGIKAVEDIDWDSLTVKGSCQEIEKRYLRLTSAPDPATVRPEEVLEKALLMVQNSQKNYLYKCDQLKSIRQDLTVQHIHNELTVKVYETHARLAIEAGDLAEYNQCQSQLKTLYAEGIKGCHMEFAAYNLLCVILHSYNNRELLSAMSRLSAEARKDEAVKHALAVREAVTSGNYILFFRLYRTAPNLNSCLMDLYVEKMRYAAVRCMSRSYRPTVPVSYISQVLGFTRLFPSTESSEEKDRDGLEECVEWLKTHGACLTADNSGEMLLDAKASTSSLYMPEPEDAVAHGDSSLGVDDFLTRNSGLPN